MVSKAYGIAQRVYRECDFGKSECLDVEEKSDKTLVTNLDRRVEEIVIEEVQKHYGKVLVIAEEHTSDHFSLVDKVHKSSKILTVDGIDGTGDFVRHVRGEKSNRYWLVALTCLMQRDPVSQLFKPLFAFAYRPCTSELFLYEQGKAWIVSQVFSSDSCWVELRAPTSASSPLGNLDVAITKHDPGFTVSDESLVHGYGPSGYNMAELAVAAGKPDTSELNFTMFQYKAWDFGLWPVLHAAGYKFIDFGSGKQSQLFDPSRFIDRHGRLSVIHDPIIICVPGHEEIIRRSIKRTL